MKKIILLALLMSGSFMTAQEYGNLSGSFESNFKWYNDDPKTKPFVGQPGLDETQIRSNNYLELDYTYKNWGAGVQVESYLPKRVINYSPKYEGTNLSTFYAEYRGEQLKVTAGYFYEQFGSGLILRSWEERQLGINNAILGGRVTYRPTDDILLTGLYGRQKQGFELSDGQIFGFNTEVGLSDILKMKDISLGLGFSYVGRYQDKTYGIANPEFEPLTNAFSGRVELSTSGFYANAEYVYKSKDIIRLNGSFIEDFVKPGNALLLTLGYVDSGLGISATLRRLENMSFYSDREAAGNEYNMSVMNYIPALTKQQDYLLANIYVYQAQPSVFLDRATNVNKTGEIGGQFDVYYYFKRGSALGGKYGTRVSFNASYWSNLEGEYSLSPIDYNTDFIGFGEKYFSDVNLEIRKRLSPDLKMIFSYINQYYNGTLLGKQGAGEVKTDIAVAEANYSLNNKQSFRFVVQHMWTEQDRKNWAGATVEFNLNRNFSFYASDIYNYGNDDESRQIHYYNIGASYSYGPSRFAINYGRQRGGIICVGGVCRYVPESTGLSVNISYVF